ncbi:MAG: RDD family protein, partial [Flavobacteriales bacterium]|nr:RDD family protein [Flavobacteriales bacterium]
EKASIDKLLLRALIKITGSFVGIIGFIIFIGCFFVLGEKKQALHDIICKTAVYKKSEIV